MQVARKSIMTGQWHVRDVDITPEQLRRINTPGRTDLIQHIAPDLSPSDREFLMTGVTPEEWASMGWDEGGEDA